MAILLTSILTNHMLHLLCQVKVQTWVNNRESDEFVGVGARFGPIIEAKEKHANRTPLLLADPSDCCTSPTEKVGLASCFVWHSFNVFSIST
jgi:hypothetical protein